MPFIKKSSINWKISGYLLPVFLLFLCPVCPSHGATPWWENSIIEHDSHSGTIRIGNEGLPRIAYISESSGNKLRLATKNGTAWTIEDMTQEQISGYSFLLSEENLPWFAYSTTSPGPINLMHSVNGTLIHEVSDGHLLTSSFGFRALALDSRELPHLAIPGEGSRNISLSHLWQDEDGWHDEEIASNSSRDAAIAVDKNGNIHAVYLDTSTNRLMYAVNRGYSWDVMAVDNGYGGSIGAFDMVLDSSGTPHLCYSVLGTYHALYHAYKSGGSWDREKVAGDTETGPDAGSVCSIATDRNDNTHIAYSVKDSNGSSTISYTRHWSTMWSTSTGLAGMLNNGDISLAVDSCTIPHIVFEDDNNALSWLHLATEEQRCGSFSMQNANYRFRFPCVRLGVNDGTQSPQCWDVTLRFDPVAMKARFESISEGCMRPASQGDAVFDSDGVLKVPFIEFDGTVYSASFTMNQDMSLNLVQDSIKVAGEASSLCRTVAR